MIIPCFRCGKEINTPDASNADYIIAEDTLTEELRDVLIAVQFTEEAKGAMDEIKSLEAAALKVPDELRLRASQRARTVVPSVEAAKELPDLERVEVERRLVAVQKTGIICPGCYRDTDTVIWGVHKEKK